MLKELRIRARMLQARLQGIGFHLRRAADERISWNSRRMYSDNVLAVLLESSQIDESEVPLLRMDIFDGILDMSRYRGLRRLEDILEEYHQLYEKMTSGTIPSVAPSRLRRAVNYTKEAIYGYEKNMQPLLRDIEDLLQDVDRNPDMLATPEDLETFARAKETYAQYKSDLENTFRDLEKVEQLLQELG